MVSLWAVSASSRRFWSIGLPAAQSCQVCRASTWASAAAASSNVRKSGGAVGTAAVSSTIGLVGNTGAACVTTTNTISAVTLSNRTTFVSASCPSLATLVAPASIVVPAPSGTRPLV